MGNIRTERQQLPSGQDWRDHDPAFRGILSALWNGGQVSVNNPYVKPWAFRCHGLLRVVRRVCVVPRKARIDCGGGSQAHIQMNPAHIVYQCLTDTAWGMGYPTSSLMTPVQGSGGHAVR